MTTRADIHLIAYSNELVNGETVYTSSNYLQIKASHFEPVGHSFHDVALKLHGYYEEENVADDNENFPKDKETEYMQSSDSYSSKGKKKSGDKAAQQDHYALLGLGHLRYLATEDQIRKSYRETTIKHHPDKQAALLLGEETEAAKHCDDPYLESYISTIGVEFKPWGKEEIDLLRKGIAKYPKGTSRQWEVISEYIGTGRSVEEILKATKTVLLQKPDSAKAFD
ncbi:putative transcription factor MYB-related family [Helianthus annuus]|nr:putative transcription factor MYB-related family [Helianthus annuus]